MISGTLEISFLAFLVTLDSLVILFLEFSAILVTWVTWTLEFLVISEILEISFLVFWVTLGFSAILFLEFLDSWDSLVTEIDFQMKFFNVINVNLETNLGFWRFW